MRFEDTFDFTIEDTADSFKVAMVAKSGFLLGTVLCEVTLPCSQFCGFTEISDFFTLWKNGKPMAKARINTIYTSQNAQKTKMAKSLAKAET